MFLNFLGMDPAPSAPDKVADVLSSLRFVRSPTARSVALRADPARCQVCLVVPRRMSESRAWAFAASQRDWINEQLAKMHKPVPFVDGAVIPILGVERTIRIMPNTSRSTHCELTKKELIVHTNRPDPSTNIKNYLSEMLLEIIVPMANDKAKDIGRKVHDLQLRNTRTRWGSCSPEGKLMFSWRLIFTSMNIIDYIVSHEVAHLRYMSHGPRFWTLCEKLSDDMSAKGWLKANGDQVLQYGNKAL